MEKFLKGFALSLLDMVRPLLEAFQSKEKFVSFLHSLGWLVDDSTMDMEEVKSAFSFISELDALADILESLVSDDSDTHLYQELFEAVVEILPKIKDISLNLDIAKLPPPLNDGQIILQIEKQLINTLIVNFLRDYQPFIYGILSLVGLISYETIDAGTAADRLVVSEYPSLQWSALGDLFKDPLSIITRAYSWNDVSEGFRWLRLFENIQNTLLPLDVPVGILQPQANLRSKYFDAGFPGIYDLRELRIPIFAAFEPSINAFAELSFVLFPVPPAGQRNQAPVGFLISLYADGKAGISIPLAEGWSLAFAAEADSGIGVEFRPGGANIVNNLFSSNPSSIAEAGISIILIKDKEKNKTILLGVEGATRFELRGLEAGIEALGDLSGDYDIGFSASIINAALIIQSSDGDGFLNKVLPKDPIEISFDLTLGYSTKRGFYVSGGAGLEYSFQIQKSLGPIFINTVDLGLYLSGEGLSLVTAISGGLAIGPVAAAVDKIGLKTDIVFGKPGLLGNADLELGFKPPSGIGISIAAGPVKGGGFLSIDKPNYMGMLYLSVQNMFEITAFGILTTELPEGKKGFSLIFCILAKFTPIQLGFGFALKGVGGIIGIHRAMREEALRKVVKDHSLDCILFPPNPVKDAVRILTAIQEIFPPQEDYFVIGLMVNIIWGGAIELVDFSAGIILELGGGGKLAILGLAKAALPNKDAPIVVLHMDLLGFIDFAAGTVAIDSSIYDSKILIFDLSGDMALRAGGSIGFALSIGGFNPVFVPPAGFPELKRMMIGLDKGCFSLCLSAYFAITTNSLQLGAKIEIKAELGEFKISGGAGFDALFIFTPFSFVVGMYAWITVSLGSVKLLSISADVEFSGPNPFRVKGSLSIEILFFSVEISFDKSFNDSVGEPETYVSPLAALVEQLNPPESEPSEGESPEPKKLQPCMRYELPSWAASGVTFTPEAEHYLDPLGEIVVAQNLVPLGIRLEKFGGTVPHEDENLLTLSLAEGVSGFAETEERLPFAPAQYLVLTDEQKLTLPPFESYNAGLRFAAGFSEASGAETTIAYETVIVESEEYLESLSEGKSRFRLGDVTLRVDPEFLKKSVAYASGYAYKPGVQAANENDPSYVKVLEPKYTLAGSGAWDGKFVGLTDEGKTYAEAFGEAAELGLGTVTVMDSSLCA